MSVLLSVLIFFAVLVVAGVLYDLNRRRRRVPGHDVDAGARVARADAEARRVPGGH